MGGHSSCLEVLFLNESTAVYLYQNLHYFTEIKISLTNKNAAIAPWFCLRYHPAAPGSNPKHTIYALFNSNN